MFNVCHSGKYLESDDDSNLESNWKVIMIVIWKVIMICTMYAQCMSNVCHSGKYLESNYDSNRESNHDSNLESNCSTFQS